MNYLENLVEPCFRCTKGIGMTQPVKWKDAGEALSNPALTGCHMPDGPGQLVSPPGAYLQYNEVNMTSASPSLSMLIISFI